ncbi:hypothetical protein FNAPI_5911 [Fusarium napiforme]|uniref:Uncharacterized protein n=1 Tax=Fusarium napiforme TaxID=42672 RepID=A0A8H5JKL0_9HYPO|nr:hypothetical protein FNAPI_5911 [Fusarium napiforme]
MSSLLNTKGKHLLSPQPEPQNTKRCRAIYVVESPGGTMRETDPAAFHRPRFSNMSATQGKSNEVRFPKIVEPDPGPTTGSLAASYPLRPAASRQRTYQPQQKEEQDEDHATLYLYTNHDLSQQHLSTLSVREKLRKGIAMGFANTLAHTNATQDVLQQGSQGSPGLQPMDTMTISEMMTKMDTHYHMMPDLSRLHSKGVSNRKIAEMVNQELIDTAPGATGRAEFLRKRSQHIKAREVPVRVASERLHVITGTANNNRYAPFPMLDLHPERLMRVEPFPNKNDTPLIAPLNSEGLMAWLEWACRRFGYWKLELDSLHFKHDMVRNKMLKRSVSLGTHSPESVEIADTVDALKLDARKGSITLYEANVTCGSPLQQQRWTWFKIVKPLLDIKGPVPEKYGAGDATMVFAIPTSKIKKIKEEWDPPLAVPRAKSQEPSQQDASAQLGDFGRLNLESYTQETTRQLTLEWRYSEKGIPTFAVTPHPWFMKKFPPDFLWIEDAPIYSADESWWDQLGEKAISDRDHWHYVQALMSGDICLVEAKSKKGGKWIKVAPQVPKGNTGRASMSSPGVGNYQSKMALAASGLRNEIQ